MDRTVKALIMLAVALWISSCVSGRREGLYPSVVPKKEEVSIYNAEDSSLDEAKKQTVHKSKKVVPYIENNTLCGYAKVNNLNVRAGNNLNYEIITRLSRGDKVAILGGQYGWYKILLPENCLGWIYANYVYIPQREKKLTSEKEIPGIVTGDMVRVRVKPRLNSTVLLQMDRGYEVIVVEKKENWFRIKLPQGCTGWVNSDFIEKKRAHHN